MHLFRSLRVRIIALYMALILLSLSLFGFIIYRDLDGRLRRGIDKLLESRAQGVADSVDTYWETEKREAARDGIPVETLSKIDNENFVKIAKRWVQDKTDDPDLLDIIVQIFDVKGALVTSSKNMPDMGTLPPEISRYVLAGKRRFDDATTGIAAGNPTRIRALTIPVVENRKTAYMIRVLSPMTSLESMSRYFALILLILIPIAVVLSGVIGSIMAGVSLRPVNRVIETIHKITAENLRLRITLPESHDEIRRLADTFNDMLARLEDSFLSQRQFIEDLTHELKTPLAVLKGELEVTLKRMRSASEYESVLESNLEEINRVIRMAENLLLLARLENNVAMLDKEILDAGEQIKACVEDMNVLAENKGVGLDFRMSGVLGVSGDAIRLRQLFLIVLDNAIKYTPPGGKVGVLAEKRDHSVRIIVRDTGPGIPAKDLSRVFQRFFRSSRDAKTQGFGLGLPIAKAIVEIHGGEINLISVAGEGTTIIIDLPAAP